MRTCGENEIFLENLEVDVQSRDRTYDSKCHSGHTVQSVTWNFIFISRLIAYISLLSYSRVVLVEIELMINILSI